MSGPVKAYNIAPMISIMIFRAVTLHLNDPELYSSYSDYLTKLSSKLNSLSARVVLPKAYDEVSLDLKAAYSGRGSKAFEIAWNLLKSGYFTSISLSSDPSEIYRASEFLFRISEELGPEYATMFALGSGEPPETPYFPLTKSENFGLSFSLLYPSDLYGALTEAEEPDLTLRYALSRVFGEAERRVEEAVGELGEAVPIIGIDFSLSPWMEESAAEVVSLVARSPFLGPGTPSALLEINEAILESSEGMRRIGFNETMLPMAEDDLLKELSLRLEMRARDLALLTPYCLAGLDMVLLPLSVGREDLAKLIRDVIASSRVKGRTIGLRIILADAEPGEQIELRRFGKVPVMMP
ncbi:protein of unknown function DUF711 [Candidatus Korarchaeum cryptofilum OPF8]|uniref:DUF711 family protein n=2 Tax=Candidatus Korarchaeum cryptofilum TaxID=498846 RepID=B1L5S2_KORCO|nr:protein of unknown function DUF711 [Candidatus Korarchaeum cryptofilum OPF8]